ncbi:hypothetical protein NQ314_006583 [Rhamnusium bicolor]|uniref:PiggyBac transposable element-derived protein domain-containing protein n=1 Tax=Rhamnusium bicolor TaxID=1586634 RepID=A0AAV8YZY7_9CUCU|nr:hypothetical protein NQ314_006583 [Rhamnusium bicolor]
MLNIIVGCTNIKINSISQNFSRERYVRPINLVEIKALIGVLYFAEVRKVNHMHLSNLWRTDGSGVEAFRLGMNRIRFQFPMRCVCYDDIRTRQERIQVHKLAPIRILFENFNCNQQSVTRILRMQPYTKSLKRLEVIVAFDNICIPSKPNNMA